jgi:hypothetical protein
VFMSVIRHILPVSINVSCFCDASISGQLIQLHGSERKCFTVVAFFGGAGGSACYCKEN